MKYMHSHHAPVILQLPASALLPKCVGLSRTVAIITFYVGTHDGPVSRWSTDYVGVPLRSPPTAARTGFHAVVSVSHLAVSGHLVSHIVSHRGIHDAPLPPAAWLLLLPTCAAKFLSLSLSLSRYSRGGLLPFLFQSTFYWSLRYKASVARNKMPLDKIPPDKMPPTVEFVFIFFSCCFNFLHTV